VLWGDPVRGPHSPFPASGGPRPVWSCAHSHPRRLPDKNPTNWCKVLGWRRLCPRGRGLRHPEALGPNAGGGVGGGGQKTDPDAWPIPKCSNTARATRPLPCQAGSGPGATRGMGMGVGVWRSVRGLPRVREGRPRCVPHPYVEWAKRGDPAEVTPWPRNEGCTSPAAARGGKRPCVHLRDRDPPTTPKGRRRRRTSFGRVPALWRRPTPVHTAKGSKLVGGRRPHSPVGPGKRPRQRRALRGGARAPIPPRMPLRAIWDDAAVGTEQRCGHDGRGSLTRASQPPPSGRANGRACARRFPGERGFGKGPRLLRGHIPVVSRETCLVWRLFALESRLWPQNVPNRASLWGQPQEDEQRVPILCLGS